MNTPAAQATRYRCQSDISPHCDRGNRRPTRSRCAYCGSGLRVETGRWGVFRWSAENRYPLDQARRTFARYAAADRAARQGGFVVRFVSLDGITTG